MRVAVYDLPDTLPVQSKNAPNLAGGSRMATLMDTNEKKIKTHFRLLARCWPQAHGQGLVEFALIVPLLLLLSLGILEVGRMLVIFSSTSSAAEQSARYAAVGEGADSGFPQYLDCPGIRSAAQRAAILTGLTEGDIQITYQRPMPETGGFGAIGWCDSDQARLTSGTPMTLTDLFNNYRVVVTITSVYSPIVPIVPLPPIPMTFAAARTIFPAMLGPTSTPRATRTPRNGPTATWTNVPTHTPTNTPKHMPTDTPAVPLNGTATSMPTKTSTPLNTSTSIPLVTSTPMNTPTNTPLPTLTPTLIPCVTIISSTIPGADTQTVYYEVKNTSGIDRSLIRLTMTWPGDKLCSIGFDAAAGPAVLKDYRPPCNNSSPVDVFFVYGAYTVLNGTSGKLLQLQFSKDVANQVFTLDTIWDDTRGGSQCSVNDVIARP